MPQKQKLEAKPNFGAKTIGKKHKLTSLNPKASHSRVNRSSSWTLGAGRIASSAVARALLLSAIAAAGRFIEHNDGKKNTTCSISVRLHIHDLANVS